MAYNVHTPLQSTAASLPELEQRVRDDLACLCYPPANWVVPTVADGREKVHDVVVIGGGMCGLVASFALIGAGIQNIRIFDRNPQGREGPWLTYARMETLRSPKQLTGPAYGMASLTFRAWFIAQFDNETWATLDKIPRTMWMEYLCWYRKVLDLPVENGVEVKTILPEGPLMRLTLVGEGVREKSVLARKVVMATGRDGMGHPNIPGFVEGLPQKYWAHSSHEIDFAALRGKRVAVVGVGASAVDNAAEALEAGAAEVRHLVRRKEMPCINKLMGIGSFGFTAAFPQLGDARRWQIMNYSLRTQTPAPRGSTLRVSRHPNAYFHFDAAVEKTRIDGDEIVIQTSQGKPVHADFLILGTGFGVDPLARKELDGYADKIRLWQDCFTPPAGQENADLGRFPYLANDFTFLEREPGQAPWLANIHSFNSGATASLGKVSGDIPGISEGAAWLAQEIAAKLYTENFDQYWQRLLDYDTPELRGDEWTASPLPDNTQTAARKQA
ncbi:FAD-dependent oxidoreductase [Rhizobium sp. Root73]|uniref:NAD(P)-binding domain-containing protein n=1 Tax=unclassified Rhizobium TaxID=2613769 RepID=UPI000726822D|nr:MULTISPECIES: NAD(P)/FAD-dependent oxidoreductase [unclassified Rhizobium]KQY16791.1 FAD-dependent oxidoreductase [Rhizobium sp. Root1334]KRC11352.1 FAD-dependent oxidoreductase [Rhizobium sp. Root73]